MMRKGGFKRELGTGQFTKDHLQKQPDYIQEICRALRKWCEKKGYHPPTYESYRSYFQYMKKLNLVEKYGEKESKWRYGAKRIYYRLNPEKLDDPAWANPRKFWYMRNPKVKRNREEKTN